MAHTGGRSGRALPRKRTKPPPPSERWLRGSRARNEAVDRGSPYCRAMAMRRRSSGEMKWSLSSTPTSSWTQWILPVNLLAWTL